MTKEEKKAYILKTWNISSGDRIKEMLLRYWNLKPRQDNYNTAYEVFLDEIEGLQTKK